MPSLQASGRGHLPVVLALLDAKADPNACHTVKHESPISIAARKGHLDVIRALLAAGASVSVRIPPCVDSRGSVGCTPLWAAAQNGFADVADLLLQQGADANESDSLDVSALHVAAARGSIRTVACLIANRANVSITSAPPAKHTPLFYAAQHGHADVAQHLIFAGADPATCDASDGQTAVSIAAECGNLQVMQVLVEEGAKTGTSLTTPTGATNADLWLASSKGHASVVQWLLCQPGVEVNRPGSDGTTATTPYQVARSAGHHDAAELLRLHGGR